MKTKNMLAVAFLLAATAMDVANLSAQDKINTDPKQQLPDPNDKPPVSDKPIKVFVLMGQSNMVGFGRINPETTQGTLAHLTKKENKYSHLFDSGKWTVRNDVWCIKTTVGQKQDWLQPG